MVYTVEHGVQKTWNDWLWIGVRYTGMGFSGLVLALAVTNVWYATHLQAKNAASLIQTRVGSMTSSVAPVANTEGSSTVATPATDTPVTSSAASTTAHYATSTAHSNQNSTSTEPVTAPQTTSPTPTPDTTPAADPTPPANDPSPPTDPTTPDPSTPTPPDPTTTPPADPAQ